MQGEGKCTKCEQVVAQFGQQKVVVGDQVAGPVFLWPEYLLPKMQDGDFSIRRPNAIGG